MTHPIRPSRWTLGLATLVTGLLALPAPAGAAVTATRVSAPADGAVVIDNQDAPPAQNVLNVSGTATAAPSGDHVDLVCVTGPGSTDSTVNVKQGIPVANGAFAAAISRGDLQDFFSGAPPAPCFLRAIPSGPVPDDVHAFVPARVAPVRITRPQSWDFNVRAANFLGSADIFSVGGCGVCGTYLSSPSLRESNPVFARAAALDPADTSAAFSARNRSEIRVDGKNAYAPAAIAPGPGLSFSRSVDSRTGVVTVHEREEVYSCSGAAYATSDCGTSSPTGVRLTRTILTGSSGRTVRVSDSWESADGHRHRVELWYDNLVLGSTAGFRFPGEQTMRAHAAGDTLGAPPARPGTIFVKPRLAAPDGDATDPPGAVTFDTPYDGAAFVDNGPSQPTFVLKYSRSVERGRPFRLREQLAAGFLIADVVSLAHSAEDLFAAPRLSISSPRNRATLTSSPVRVRGIARDNYAVASLRVAGRRARVGSGGRWSALVRLRRGRSTILAVARDRAGNSTSARVRVTYRPCVVPRLTGRDLARARVSLRRAGCLLGGVRGPRRAGRVVAQSRRPGRVLMGSHRRVSITLGR